MLRARQALPLWIGLALAAVVASAARMLVTMGVPGQVAIAVAAVPLYPGDTLTEARWIWLWVGRDGLGLRGWRLLPEPEDRGTPPIAAGHPGLTWLATSGQGRWVLLPVRS